MNWRDPAALVRNALSTWIMRAREGGSVLQIGFWGVTALSTTTSALYQLGYGRLAVPVIGVTAAGCLVFIWAYDEFDLLRRQQRARMDSMDNFAGPGMAIGHLIGARQYAALADSIAHGEEFDDALERIEGETVEALREYRDGIDVPEIYHGVGPTQAQRGRRPVADGGEDE